MYSHRKHRKKVCHFRKCLVQVLQVFGIAWRDARATPDFLAQITRKNGGVPLLTLPARPSIMEKNETSPGGFFRETVSFARGRAVFQGQSARAHRLFGRAPDARGGQGALQGNGLFRRRPAGRSLSRPRRSGKRRTKAPRSPRDRWGKPFLLSPSYPSVLSPFFGESLQAAPTARRIPLWIFPADELRMGACSVFCPTYEETREIRSLPSLSFHFTESTHFCRASVLSFSFFSAILAFFTLKPRYTTSSRGRKRPSRPRASRQDPDWSLS